MMSVREVRDVASGSEDSKAMGVKLWWWWWCVVMVDAVCWAWSNSRMSLSETATGGGGSRCMVSLQLEGLRYDQGLWVNWTNSATIQGHLRRGVKVTSMAREADPTWSLTGKNGAPDFS